MIQLKHKIASNWLASLIALLYVSIAAATFRHSMYGFATLESGSLVWGALSALAIDVGMMLSASGLRRSRHPALVAGLSLSALASTYTQLLYSVSSAQAVAIAPGAAWLGDWATRIADARVVALPALLPLLSVIYAFAAKSLPGAQGARDELEQLAVEVRAETANKTERARRIWAMSGNGHGALSASEVARLARCHVSTARKARPAGANG